MKNSDMPASALHHNTIKGFEEGYGYDFLGLTKLEHFAGLAMQGYLASGNADGYRELIAGWSVRDARTLLAALERQQ
jgi:hypothetical protein